MRPFALVIASLVSGCALDAEPPTERRATPAVFVSLAYGETRAMVDAGTLPTELRNGTAVVSLSQIWAAGKLPGDRTQLVFELQTGDGFRPPTTDACMPTLPGTQLANAYLVLATRTIVVDGSVAVPSCCATRTLAKMTARER